MRLTTREEWLEERKKTIGASEVPTIMGLNPWETPLQLAARRLGRIPEKEETDAMRMGHRLEPVIDAMYQEETGRQTINLGEYTIQYNKDYPYMHCTLDRQVQPCVGRDMPGVGEYKAPGARMAGEWEDGIPLYVQCQVQAQMAVCKMDWGSVAALVGGQTFLWGDVERNDKFIEQMLAATYMFSDSLRRGELPDAEKGDHDALKLLYLKEESDTEIILPADAGTWIDALEDAKRRKKLAEGTIEDMEAQLFDAMRENERGLLLDGRVYRWKTVSRKAHSVAASSSRQLRRVNK
jgi:putative phage-type endonuclease